MKKLIKYIWLAILAMGIVCCDPGDFDSDITTNPNATTVPITSNLLTNALRGIPGTITATQGQLYVQYLANSQYTSADTYQTINFSYNGWYSGMLQDLETVIDLNTDEETKQIASANGSNANQIAVAKILQSFIYLHMTDRWGDIPYSEALRNDEGILAPAFDTQQAVYNGIFSTLADAVNMMDGGAGVSGDILFGGDMDMWKKFANTARLVAALRLSNVDPSKGNSEFNAAISAGVIAADNSENISYTHLEEANNENPWFSRFRTRRDYTVANTLVDYMQSTANGGTMDVAMDPRLPVFADATESSNFTEYVGMTYGVSEAVAGSIDNSDVSFLGAAMRAQGAPTYIFTSAQVLFSMAEAVKLGWISGSAEQYYNDAIQASLNQYGVGSEYATFITNSEVAYDDARALEQIGNQKWVALFLNGYEAWAEWRRTGYPNLTPAIAAQNESGQIPVREGYPTTEPNLNADNYAAVVARQGEDDLDTRIWWDTN
ncbi:SusD/RagB family nutrient-binding outer membrane lipoprotein [Fulvivirgaceae bacterium BMA10]|uniref:SusD/RagB family nutrient-binding outer membrane lipoprotein n=1 Tax=Splendidivirga corallicola TaxID=3051826 RepID=A0ABT8KT91_9BACT|nr:SusD/RagB family nutrient-binding outer membrane lipoprotein [Fulvivirgaceae bacterium BMA10]